MGAKPGPGVLNWLKRPDSWLSVSAAVISLVTFYLVYLSGGRVQIEMPEEVGLEVSPIVSLLMPVVFYHTGPSQKESVVRTVVARLLPAGPGLQSKSIDLEWVHSSQFISRKDYEKKYPDENKLAVQDFVVYDARAFPFILFGGNSATKILALEPSSPLPYEMLGPPPIIDISATVETTAGNFVAASVYRLKSPSVAGSYSWYRRVSNDPGVRR